MLKQISNKEISRSWWDDTIAASPSGDPYPYSWYLDIICPGWNALLDENTGMLMPLPIRHKASIRYIYTPIFLQRLGFYSSATSGEESISALLDYLYKNYRLIDLAVAGTIGEFDGEVNGRNNYYLNLASDYSSLNKAFTPDCRRVVKLAISSKQKIVKGVDPGEAINLFRKGPGRNVKEIKLSDYNRLNELMLYCCNTGIGDIYGVYSGTELVYSLFYIKYSGKITMLFISTSALSRKMRSGYKVINRIIEENAGSGLIIDFAGSSIRGVEHFIQAFGSKREEYYHLYRNALPFPLKQLLLIKRQRISR